MAVTDLDSDGTEALTWSFRVAGTELVWVHSNRNVALRNGVVDGGDGGDGGEERR